MIAAGAQGYAEATPAEISENPIIRLQPWGRLEGTWLSGGKPASGRELFFQFGSAGTDAVGSDFQAYDIETDGNGRFTFPKVPPGLHKLARRIPLDAHSWTEDIIRDLAIRPGKTTTVTLASFELLRDRAVALACRFEVGRRDARLRCDSYAHSQAARERID